MAFPDYRGNCANARRRLSEDCDCRPRHCRTGCCGFRTMMNFDLRLDEQLYVAPAKRDVAKIRRAGEGISAQLSAAGGEGKVATLLPIYVLEGGGFVYPELATGQFIYRSAEMTAPDLLAHYKTTRNSKNRCSNSRGSTTTGSWKTSPSRIATDKRSFTSGRTDPGFGAMLPCCRQDRFFPLGKHFRKSEARHCDRRCCRKRGALPRRTSEA
jgi:hypothetical protein